MAERSAAEVTSRRLALAPLALVSLASIGYEIALTRFFAVAEWSDYGYWVISIAMAGFALSGVVLALARDTAARHGPAILGALPTLLILAAAAGFAASAANPFNPLQLQNPVTWTTQVWNIAGYYAALLPFFFLAGLFVSLSFVLNAGRIGAVYAWDLCGAGAGAALVMVLMFVVHPFRLVPALVLALGLAAFLLPRRWPAMAAGVALIAAQGLLFLGPQPHVNDFKAMYAPSHTQGSRVLAQRLSPAGVYDLLDDFTEREDTDLSNDAAMLGIPGPPRTFGLYRDGERIAALPMPKGIDAAFAPATLDALPYELIPHPSVLLAGASGGFRVAEALRLGAAHVEALEPEQVLNAALRQGLGPSPALPADPRVQVSSASLLGALRGDARYDLIDISADFLAAAPVNQTAFTTHALTAALRSLKPAGLVSVPVSIRDLPVYALRLLATARDALRDAGVSDPGDHVVIYRSAWNARLLLSPQPFDPARIAAIRKFCDQRSFDLSWYPGIDVAATKANIYNDLPAISFAEGEVSNSGPDDSIADEAAAVLSGSPSASQSAFLLDPITLDRPAFYATLRLSQLGVLLRRLEVLPQPEIGALINLAVLAQAAVIALAVLMLPLAAPRKLAPSDTGIGRVLVYFPALALGFLFIEITLIQEATLWLNDRASAFALVLTGMLVFSGLGSAASGWLGSRGSAQRIIAVATAAILVWSLLAALCLQNLVLATLAWPWAARAVLLLVVVAPVSFALGLPFPLGLAQVGAGGALPWAWALNGAFSVLATPLANLIARDFGFSRVLFCATAMYALAGLTFPSMRRRTAWFQLPVRSPGAD